ncbi:MAG: hypothetical protein HYZ54_00010 [Ignavibacteriae bacterium]|nr:hypothetical protein [Ignavibacteriota bacterium]
MTSIRTNNIPVKLLVLLFLIITSVISSNAQEQQVSFDSAGKILVITPQQATLVPLFDEYGEFKEILLFKIDESTFTLEITSLKDGILQRKRVSKNRIEIDTLRARIDRIIYEKSPELGLDQSGRAEFLTYTFIVSLTYYGPMLVLATDPHDLSSGSLIYIMGGAGGFFIPYLITSKSNVTKGASALGINGSAIGIATGYFLYGAIGGWNNLRSSGQYNYQTGQYENGNDSKYRAMIGLSVATGIIGTIAGVTIANKYNISDGDAGVIGSSWAGGLGLAFGAEYISGLLEKDDSKHATASYLLGASALSIYAGTQLARTQHFTRSDASIMVTPAYIAALLPLSIAAIIHPDNVDGKLIVGTTMASYLLGEYIGWQIVKNKDFSESSGIFTGLGTVGGGLIGIGLGIAFDREYRSVSLFGVLGATAGYALMVNSFSEDAAAEAKSHSSLRWDVSPIGLAMIASGNNNSGKMTIPIGSVQWKF